MYVLIPVYYAASCGEYNPKRDLKDFTQEFKRLSLMEQKGLYRDQKIIKIRKKHIQVRRNAIREKIYISQMKKRKYFIYPPQSLVKFMISSNLKKQVL